MTSRPRWVVHGAEFRQDPRYDFPGWTGIPRPWHLSSADQVELVRRFMTMQATRTTSAQSGPGSSQSLRKHLVISSMVLFWRSTTSFW
ncbi:uncharacterized protein [Physcomitrium patens]|uniref:uncharacterized protein isoform X9 n=1 Tax=Physcomitrium patens TaxID=3218 RepID=UPI003CCD39E1